MKLLETREHTREVLDRDYADHYGYQLIVDDVSLYFDPDDSEYPYVVTYCDERIRFQLYDDAADYFETLS